jgi:hypothetical protein
MDGSEVGAVVSREYTISKKAFTFGWTMKALGLRSQI